MALRYKIPIALFLAISVVAGMAYIFFGKDMLQISQNEWVGNSTGAAEAPASSTAQYDFIATVPKEFVATDCESGLWQHNAEDEKVSVPCIYVTGTVVKVKSEDDGDMNIQLKPDPQYSVLLNSYNIKDGAGNLGVEPICVVSPSKPAFIKSCKGYSSQITIPAVGTHIGVKGSYGQDKHYWMEMHPVTSISIL